MSRWGRPCGGGTAGDRWRDGGAAALIGELLGLTALVMFAANALVVGEASRRGSHDFGFLVALAGNTAVAAGIVVVEAGLGGVAGWDAVAVLHFFLAGVFATYLGRLLFWITVVRMGPSRATAFQITQPLFASVLALVFLGQRLRAAEVAFMLLALCGLWVVNRSRRPPAGSPPRGSDAASSPGGRPGGGRLASARALRGAGWRQHVVLVAVGSGLAYGGANVLRGAAIARWNEPFVGSFLGALAGLACYGGFHVRLSEVLAQLRTIDRRALWLFALSGLLSIFAQTAAIASLRYLPVAIANMFAVSVPIVVVPLSVLLLRNREGVNRLTAAGVVMTWSAVAGLVLF